jgi:cation diffusion facilitator CzcD-associated flavoprotein CzcO
MRGEEAVEFTCNFLFLCGGYYKYEAGYTPDFAGTERFKGRIAHPQFWTEDIDYKDKQVLIIGSGATAVTLVPAMAKQAAHVTMVQRSPTYMFSLPAVDRRALWLRKYLPPKLAYRLIRWRNILFGLYVFNRVKRKPEQARRLLLDHVQKKLGPDYDIETHFTPHYKPWDQRLCLVPDDDFFDAIKDGHASVVTDHIETFTEDGLKLASGKELKADLIVTATGLELEVFNGIDIRVDDVPVKAHDTMSYKGMMYSDVPNLASSFGYTNASWTLKCDLTCDFVCRLLNYMERKGVTQCTPRLTDPSVEEAPWLDFSSGYVQRSIHLFPKQGTKGPWRLRQNYLFDIFALRFGKMDDGALEFSNPKA